MNAIENIQRIRIEKRLSQAEMAERLGIAQNNYGKIERGITELTVQRLYKIAEILGSSPAELLGLETLKLEENQKIEENKNLKEKIDNLENIINDNNMIADYHYNNSYLGIFEIIDDILEKVFEKIILKHYLKEEQIGRVKIRNKGSLQELSYQSYVLEIVNSEDWKSVEMMELILTPKEINILFRIIFDSYDSNERYTIIFFDRFIFSLMNDEEYKSKSKYLKHFEFSEDVTF